MRDNIWQMPNQNSAKLVHNGCRLVDAFLALAALWGLEAVLETGHLFLYFMGIVSCHLQLLNIVTESLHIKIYLNCLKLDSYKV
jgi:hypothetical protein